MSYNSTRAKRHRITTDVDGSLNIWPPLRDIDEFSLEPIQEALTRAHADEASPDLDFQSLISHVLPEYLENREMYLSSLGQDGLGHTVEHTSPAALSRIISQLDVQRGRCGLVASDDLLLRKLKVHQHRKYQNIHKPGIILPSPSPSSFNSLDVEARHSSLPTLVLRALQAIRTTPYAHSFLSRLVGLNNAVPSVTVHTDWQSRAPWVELMDDLCMHRRLKCPEDDLPDMIRAPITYVTLSHEHLPQVHDLLKRVFWEGVNVHDSMRYEPERATVVAVYKRLVVGVALLSSPQETYITYLAVRAGWENTQIATTMLYFIILRNPERDITLHVSANNPAMLLYNRFGFKAEEFVVGFYDAYLDPNARVSKNAFRLRLRS